MPCPCLTHLDICHPALQKIDLLILVTMSSVFNLILMGQQRDMLCAPKTRSYFSHITSLNAINIHWVNHDTFIGIENSLSTQTGCIPSVSCGFFSSPLLFNHFFYLLVKEHIAN